MPKYKVQRNFLGLRFKDMIYGYCLYLYLKDNIYG
jgi:hypothetical protein